MVKHYHWAGLDFMLDEDGTPVFLEANRCSHMLREYLDLGCGSAPFAAVAHFMDEAEGPPCLLWRRDDRPHATEENACWIGAQLTQYLRHEPRIAFVEDNAEEWPDLIDRDGQRFRPGSVFRWWYPLPWAPERSGTRVVNPNAVWVTVRDKLTCYRLLAGAVHSRAPRSFAVESPSEAVRLLAEQPALFRQGFVLKPRVGFGGHGVQVADPGDAPRTFPGGFLLSERIRPRLRAGRYWDARTFVMAGRYHGGLIRIGQGPVTNVFQGGTAQRLDRATATLLEAATLETVHLLDRAADAIHQGPIPHDHPLLRVVW